jgi:erythromycin esterase
MRTTGRLVLCALAGALLCGCGAEGGGTTEPPKPPVPAPVELPTDPQQLLDDAQLVPEADPSPPAVGEAIEGWIRANHHPVRSLTSDNFSDLQFLKPVLAGRRLVQLGESGHGVREFSLAKVRLIRFLHEEMGFDVVAFESGLLDCWLADEDIPTAPTMKSVGNCVFGVWHTQEVLRLFEYIQATRSTARPLLLAGFDVQPSGRKVLERPAFFRDVAARVDPAFARRAYVRDSTLMENSRGTYAATYAYIRANRESLLATYDTLATLFQANRARLDAADPARPALGRVAHMAARSTYLYTLNVVEPLPHEIRDRGMADNMTFLLRELYPDKKIVVWAHNAHIRHAGERTVYHPENMMGSVVAERHRPELYTIGFYMYRGVSADNTRKGVRVTQPFGGSLEGILYHTRRRWAFVDLLGQTPGPGRDWMFNEITAKEWGVVSYRMSPRQQYDGIFWVHDVNVPEYLPPL